MTAIEFLSEQFTYLLGYTYAGSGFVFGYLVDGQLFGRPFQLVDGDSYFLAPPFFFNVLPSVIFFSALVSMGYYLRILPFLVRKVGYFLAICLGTSASESLSAAGNIFIGQTEAPLLVRPFMPEMTESELHAVMTGGFATIAGSVFGVYISFGIDGVAILAASAMSAPAALAISKLTYPETEDSPTSTGKKGAYDIPSSDHVNVIHAATDGAVVGTQLMLNIAGNLVAFLAIIAMLDAWLYYFGERVDIYLSFNAICEVVFYPFAWLMGVDAEDCREVAVVLGLKIFANEFVAYEKLAFTFKDQISDRSFYIASYALCGFSNFGSIGIQLGGLTPLAPNQGKKLAKLVFSAMIAGNTACFMTACIAGIFYEAP
uniref:Sodium/nucleoside cotransporter n=1 Tax=Grammatophora oceanica TaxID=210454 RepID=A0A7S1VSV7_9STRA